MFDLIAEDYDPLNRVISFGFDVGWRREMVKAMRLASDGTALDVATGTGDVALAILKIHPESKVVGVDITEGMLDIARRKARAAGVSDRADLRVGDVAALDFEDNSFDAVSCAFGMRNFADRAVALENIIRVLKPGGRLAVIEPSLPTRGIFATVFGIYFRKVLPRVGALISDKNAYRYLVQSVANFPSPNEFLIEMENAGFARVGYMGLTGGAATLYVGEA